MKKKMFNKLDLKAVFFLKLTAGKFYLFFYFLSYNEVFFSSPEPKAPGELIV